MPKKTSKLSLKVLKTLVQVGKPIKPDELASLLGINQRSIRYALNILADQGLVAKIPDMEDLRTNYYYPEKIVSDPNTVVAEAL